MWKMKDNPKTVRVTKKLANEFVEMTPAPHDRPLSERRLQVYERIMAEGGFRPCNWAKAFCEETNETYRVNGKHTSTLFSGLNVIPDNLFVVIEDYICDTLEDVAKLYGTYDSSLMSRTASEINASFAGVVPELKEFGRKVIDLGVSGINYYSKGEAYSHTPAPERAEVMFDETEFFVFLSRMFDGGKENVRTIQRMPVVAAMYACWKKSQKAAEEFWTSVRDETGSSPSLPDRKLARYLMTIGVNNGGGAHKVRKAPNREFLVKCLRAWNAWRKGEPTNLNYSPEGKIPAAV